MRRPSSGGGGGHGAAAAHRAAGPARGSWMPQVLEESDLDGDGALNFEEFQRAVAHSDIRAKLTIMF